MDYQWSCHDQQCDFGEVKLSVLCFFMYKMGMVTLLTSRGCSVSKMDAM